MSKMVLFTNKYGSYNVFLKKRLYDDGNLAISAVDEDGCPAFTATIDPGPLPKKDIVYIKNYSENEGVLGFLIDLGIVIRVAGHAFIAQSSYASVPICKIDMDKLNEYT